MKYLISLIFSLWATASAFCPNLCNGHGKCGNQDRCSCYTYAGTTRGDLLNQYDIGDQRASWTGADCSLRTCPLSFSWAGSIPNGLSTTLNVATVSSSNYVGLGVSGISSIFGANNANFASTYKNFAPGQKIRLYTAKVGGTSGIYTIASSNYTYDNAGPPTSGTIHIFTVETITSTYTTSHFAAVEPWETEASSVTYNSFLGDYGQWDANGAHNLMECAGQGVCDRTTGQCNCFPGYEGEACTRTSCPNSCSGHGVCLETYRIAADFGLTYEKAWDSSKHFGCKCDVGFRGPDCSLQECPSDYDPLNGCGGGRCNTGGYYVDKTGTPQKCPNAVVYSTTVNNVIYNIGTSDCVTGEQRDCSGRGICDYSSGVCNCFSGFYGESCNIQTVLV